MELYHYFSGSLPLLVNIPHAGTFVPDEMLEKFTLPAKRLPDTDWHVAELYKFAKDMGAHMLIATHSRYVVDLNRDPNDKSLYPGKFTTTLCPTTQFDSSPIYSGHIIHQNEIKERIKTYWEPYHQKLQNIIHEQKNNNFILLDAHSIRSQVPTLFEGTLPDLNIGTADGTSANNDLIKKILTCCKNNSFSHVHNGRFKGGYITRNYGKPSDNIHAIQLELAQHNYMNEDYPYQFDAVKAAKLQDILRQFLAEAIEWLKEND